MRIMKPMAGRKRLSYGAAKKIRSRIEYLARIHDCSMSFVQNTLLARILNIDIGEAFDERPQSTRKATDEETRARLGNIRDRASSSRHTH
jgi:hypothetical protein